MEARIKEKLSKDLLERQFKIELEKEVKAKAAEITAQYDELNKKWGELSKFEKGKMDQFKPLQLPADCPWSGNQFA